MVQARTGKHRMLTSAHNLAELYSVLTTLPVSPRLSPGIAARMVRENVEAHAQITALTQRDYSEVIRALGEDGLTGGIVYDALALRAAVRGGADLVVTLNPRDFRRIPLASEVKVEEP